MENKTAIIRLKGRVPYAPCLAQMQDFTSNRLADTTDEIWLLEHHPVYSFGLNAKSEHLLRRNHIPVVYSDRGGQVTYHGPGQIIAYVLLDLSRAGYGVRELVTRLEQSVIALLKLYGLSGTTQAHAPGVYLNEEKMASVGLRIKGGKSYHGISFNADMEMQPFQDINPCGYPHLVMTQLKQHAPQISIQTVRAQWIGCLCDQLGYAEAVECDTPA